MVGFVFISSEAMQSKAEFDYWIELSLEFNKIAKASNKKDKQTLKNKTT
jgi:hypothetical protein